MYGIEKHRNSVQSVEGVIMAAIDRTTCVSIEEVKQLRTVTEARAIVDLRAGLPEELSIHSARHTVAVALLRRTGNLRQVRKQLGHSSPATTANMYADVPFEDMQSGVTGLYAG